MSGEFYCPKCGGKLVLRQDGKRYCQHCKTAYMLKTQEKESKKKRGCLLPLIVALALLAGVCGGFLVYHFCFGTPVYLQFDEEEYAAYGKSLADWEPVRRSTAELREKKPKAGDPMQVIGVVEEAGDDTLRLNNGVDCYFTPTEPAAYDRDELEAVLAGLSAGDVVAVDGMAAEASADGAALKYCGVPYVFYEGQRYYDDYETHRSGAPYPDTVHDEAAYEAFRAQVQGGNVIYTAPEGIRSAFLAGGTVTADSFAAGAALFRDQAVCVNGTVAEVGDTYIYVENIYCFFCFEVLTQAQIEQLRSLEAGEFVSVCGLVCNPSCDAFRMTDCYFFDNVEPFIPVEVGSLPPELTAVLSGEASFVNRGYDGELQQLEITASFSDGSDLYTTRSFAVVDMDGDGVNELILYAEGDFDGVFAILHLADDGLVYGHLRSYRDVESLWTTGLFWGSGGADAGYLMQCAFRGEDCEFLELAHYEGEAGLFMVHGEPVSEEDYRSFMMESGCYDAKNADFLDFTKENIQSLMS